MDESTKVVCPVCEASYRLKRYTPGKAYTCKRCGSGLAIPEAAAAAAGEAPAPAPAASGVATDARLDDIARQLQALADRLDSAPPAGGAPALPLADVTERIRETGKALLDKLDDYDNARRRDAEVLLERLQAAGSAGAYLPSDPDQPLAVDALARVADELVREQSANTTRLDILANELRDAIRPIADVAEWRDGLPERVADEIARSVESRVVGPISEALVKQAPAIFSGVEDNKLVDLVSRSVREAQRPLLREVLAGAGRGGVPAWLFAAVLLPLLLILGYLFLPGEWAQNEQAARSAAELQAVAEGLYRIEAAGAPLTAEDEERLVKIEAVVTDLHGQALAHAANAAALEEEAKGLRETLGERDRLIKEYSDMLQRQVRRLRAYEARLTRLGVTPDTVEEPAAP